MFFNPGANVARSSEVKNLSDRHRYQVLLCPHQKLPYIGRTPNTSSALERQLEYQCTLYERGAESKSHLTVRYIDFDDSVVHDRNISVYQIIFLSAHFGYYRCVDEWPVWEAHNRVITDFSEGPRARKLWRKGSRVRIIVLQNSSWLKIHIKPGVQKQARRVKVYPVSK